MLVKIAPGWCYFLTDWGFLLGFSEALIISMSVAFVAVLICCHIGVRKYVRIRIGSKLILGLAIIAAKTFARYYVDMLWLNTVTLAIVAVLAVGLDFGF